MRHGIPALPFRLACEAPSGAAIRFAPPPSAVPPGPLSPTTTKGAQASGWLNSTGSVLSSSRAIAEIDVLQFPISPPLCNIVVTPTGQPTGAFVAVNEGSVFPSHEEAFVWLDGALTDCGSAP